VYYCFRVTATNCDTSNDGSENQSTNEDTDVVSYSDTDGELSDVSDTAGLPYDARTLRYGQLTDNHIDFANDMFKRQHPTMDGLETPLLNQSVRGFSVPARDRPVVQIHNLGGHWATSHRPAFSNDVIVYDSMLSLNATGEPILVPNFVRQLKQMYDSIGQSLIVRCPRVTQQTNGIDCGVFAIAFATDLCIGVDPATREYDHARLGGTSLIALGREGCTRFLPQTDAYITPIR
jgi:hypothetical protein